MSLRSKKALILTTERMPVCPANGCPKWFQTDRGLSIHLAKSLECRTMTLQQACPDPEQSMDVDDEDLPVCRSQDGGLKNTDPISISVDNELEEDMAQEPYNTQEEVSDLEYFSDIPSSTVSSDVEEDLEPHQAMHAFPIPGPDGISPRYYKRPFSDKTKKTPGGISPYMRTQANEVDPLNPVYPFAGVQEWELAHWLGMSGLSASKIDEFLKLQWVSYTFIFLILRFNVQIGDRA